MRIQDIIIDDLALLHIVLQWSTAHPLNSTTLTVGERIMVNQERAALFRELDGEPTDFVQSDTINEKVNRIVYLIKKTKWTFKEY